MTQSIAKPRQVDLSTLYDRLRKLGFNRDFILSNGLPDWWCEEYEASNDAAVTAAMYFSRRFNLDLRSLLNPELNLTFETENTPFLKTSQHGNLKLVVAQNLALRVSELVAYTYKHKYQSILGMPARNIWAEIFNQYSGGLTLESLIAFCNQYGIPVVHFAKFPNAVEQFYGIVTKFQDRPVILVSLEDASPDRLLFNIAHQLGHIALGHLENGLTISEEEFETLDLDDDEIAANDFASQLLSGQSDQVDFCLSAKNLLSSQSIAIKTSQQINQNLIQYLEWDRLGYDNQEYLAMTLGFDICDIQEHWSC